MGQITFCAVALGTAHLRWQNPPQDPPDRWSGVLLADDPGALSAASFTDYVINVLK